MRKKVITLVLVVAIVAALVVPMTAFAAGRGAVTVAEPIRRS